MKPILINELFAELIKHLPHSITETGIEDKKSEIEISEKGRKNLPEVIKQLEGPIMKKWKRLQEQQPIDEVEIFSDQILKTGENYSIDFLVHYAKNLGSALTILILMLC